MPIEVYARLDRVLATARLRGREGLWDIGLSQGRIVAIEPRIESDAPRDDLGGRLVLPGFVDTHIHLDKSCLLGRCAHSHGDLSQAIADVSRLKKGFSEEDVYRRGAATLEKAILQGTTHMRTHVEIDPRVGLTSFRAVSQLARDYASFIDLRLCVFPQEGLTNDPGAEDLLVHAIEAGADLLGGCPYTDADPSAQMARLFELARIYNLDLDLHLDFDLDPSWTHLEEVCRLTEKAGWGGRVAIGHVTKLAAMSAQQLEVHTARLRDAGVAVTALPATDLYLNGRGYDGNAPRGVAPVHCLAGKGLTVSIATNNVLNPFTPFGDCSLLRMAGLYALVAHAGPDAFETCLDLVTEQPARLMRIENYGIAPGSAADLVLLDASDPLTALGEGNPPLAAWKNGRETFRREWPRLAMRRPASGESVA